LKVYPYLIGGFRGEVREVGGQVDPQPRAQPLRPHTQPLRGATITRFSGNAKAGYNLKYSQDGREGSVSYRIQENGSVAFRFIDASGRVSNETYSPNQRGPGGRPPRPGGDFRRPGRPKGAPPRPRQPKRR